MLLLDASALVALISARDRQHARCVEVVQEAEPPLVVPAFAMAEAAYLIGTRMGPQAGVALAQSVATGELFIEAVAAQDWPRIVDLTERYHDLPLGINDASVVAAAERLGAKALATLDRRHFAVVRPRHLDALQLLPAQLD